MGIERGIAKAMWGYDGNLEPLYDVEDKGAEILVTFDLPRVRKEDVVITTTADTVEIIAKMSNTVCWERWGGIQKRISFQAFKKQIRFPVQIDPEKATASFKNGILSINLPKMRREVLIGID